MWVYDVLCRPRSMRRVCYFESRSICVRNFTTSRVFCFPFGLQEADNFVKTVINYFSFGACRFTTTFKAVNSRLRFFASGHATNVLVSANCFKSSFATFFRVRRITCVRIRPLSGVYVIRKNAFRGNTKRLCKIRVNGQDSYTNASCLMNGPVRTYRYAFYLRFMYSNPPKKLNYRSRVLLLSRTISF